MPPPDAALDEFDLIARLFRPLTRGAPGALNLQDDVALVDVPRGKQLVVTKDAIVAGVHFLPDDPPDLIARKLVRVNLSDLAAKGAVPAGLLLATAFPKSATRDWLERFAGGLAQDVEEFAVPVLGGDTVATPGPATFSLTALGLVKRGRVPLRSAAQIDDRVWVSGTIGDGALGLYVALGKAHGYPGLLDRYRLPQPRLAAGQALVGLIHASMDISDGLVGDLGHICKASGVGAVIEAHAVPLSDEARAAIDAGVGEGLATCLTGGDDYELLFTAPSSADRRISSLSSRLGLRLSPIGRIIRGSGVRVEGADGEPFRLPGSGYRHFGQ